MKRYLSSITANGLMMAIGLFLGALLGPSLVPHMLQAQDAAPPVVAPQKKEARTLDTAAVDAPAADAPAEPAAVTPDAPAEEAAPEPAAAAPAAAPVQEVVRAKRFEIVGADDKVRAVLAADGEGTMLAMLDEAGLPRLAMYLEKSGAPRIALMDNTDNVNIQLGFSEDEGKRTPTLELAGPGVHTRLVDTGAYIFSEAGPELYLLPGQVLARTGKQPVGLRLACEADNSLLEFYDKRGNQRIWLGMNETKDNDTSMLVLQQAAENRALFVMENKKEGPQVAFVNGRSVKIVDGSSREVASAGRGGYTPPPSSQSAPGKESAPRKEEPAQAPMSRPLYPELDRYEGASIIADDGTFLGVFSKNKYDTRSVANKYGDYGSKFSTKSIWNEFGTYGSKFSVQSPFNSVTATPPQICRGNTVLAYLTVNSTKMPRVDPNKLKQWAGIE